MNTVPAVGSDTPPPSCEDRCAAAAEVARRRADLAEAWRDREVLERLRQRRHEEWRTEQERR